MRVLQKQAKMATRFLTRFLLASTKQSCISLFSRSFSSSTPQSFPISSFSLLRLRPLVAVAASCYHVSGISVRSFATRRTSSSLNDPNPNWSNRPPKETILLDGCDFEHWLVVMEKPEGEPTRDEIIDSYIKTLAKVVGSEEEARMKIYSVSTRHYFAFGALVSEELSYKLKELDKVRWVLPDSYLDVKNKDYGGEPFINGQAVPYDPKYHEEWVRNNARANERNRRNDRPRNFDRSRNYERRREMQMNPGPPPNMGSAPNTGTPSVDGVPNMGASPNMGNVPPNNMSGPPNMGGFPPSNMSGPPPNNMSGPPPNNMSRPPHAGNMPPNYGPSNMGGIPPNMSGPPNMPPNNMGGPPNPNNYSRPPNNMTGPPNMQGNNMGGQPPYNGGAPPGNFGARPYNAGGPGNAPTFQHGNAPGNYGGGPYQSTPGQHQNNYAPNSPGGYPYQNPNQNQNQNIPGRDMPPFSNSQ